MPDLEEKTEAASVVQRVHKFMVRHSRFTRFPHLEVSLRAVQPDYDQWQAVRIGMTRRQVIELLGRPRCEQFHFPTETYSTYGYLQLPMLPSPRAYSFVIGFDPQGRVFTKSDPFGGVFSPDGRPSKPKIFTPPAHARFSHYPRLVDMRWFPSSGRYPMRYEVEVGWGLDGHFTDQVIESDLGFPYYVVEFVGDQPGRFRVRGNNALGVGEWSEYREFDFTPQVG
jgi:hypothetical protein